MSIGTLDVKMLFWETARAAFFWARVCFISCALAFGVIWVSGWCLGCCRLEMGGSERCKDGNCEGLMSHMLAGTLKVVYQSLEAAKSIQGFYPIHREHLFTGSMVTRERAILYQS